MDCPVCRRPDQPATCATCVSQCLDSVHSHHPRIQYLESLRNRAAVLLANQSNPNINTNSPYHRQEDIQLDIASCSARVRALATRKEEVQNWIAQRQHHLAARRKLLQHKRHALDAAVKRANAFKVRVQHAVNIELATRRANLQKAHESIMDAWKILVPELFQIFGVEQVTTAGLAEVAGTTSARGARAGANTEPAFTIVGLKVPLDMDILGAPQDQLNAALGYTAHLTAILGMYLDIPLPFDLQLRMSATTADLHFRPDRDSLRPFATPLASTPSPPPSVSSSISRSFTSRHRSSKLTTSSSASSSPSLSRRRHSQHDAAAARLVPDNLLPIHVGHAEGAERTALGLAMLSYQAAVLAAKCGVKLPTRASKGGSSKPTTRRKLAPIDLVALLASVAEAVVAGGGPLAPRAASPDATVMAASTASSNGSAGTGAGGAGVRPVSFRTLLAQITRKIYRDESKSGFRIVRPVMEGVAKSGVPRRPPSGAGAAAASVQLLMSETGVLVPRTPPGSVASAAGGEDEDDDDEGEDVDSEEDDEEEDDLSDEDDEYEEGDEDEAFDPDQTISAARLDAARADGASFIAIDSASVMAQSVAPGEAQGAVPAAMSSPSIVVGTRAGKSSAGKSKRHGSAKSSAMARSIMVRSVLAAAEGPRATPSHSMLVMRQSAMAAEAAVGTPSPSLVLPPQGHIHRPLPPHGLGQEVGRSQEQAEAAPAPEDDEWEELDKTITLSIPPRPPNPDDLLNEYAPPMTASVALLSPPRRAMSDSKLMHPAATDSQDDDDDLALIEPPSNVPAGNDELIDASGSPSSSASSSRVLLSSVWNIGRRALSTSYHLAVTAVTAGIVSGPTSASSAMADAGNGLFQHSSLPGGSGTPITRSPVYPANALRSRQQHPPISGSSMMPTALQQSRQAPSGMPASVPIARPLVGRSHAPAGVPGSRVSSSSASGGAKKRSSGGTSALTRSAL